MEETLKTYKHTLYKLKQKRTEQQLETLSETPLSLSEVTTVVECEAMWEDDDDIVKRAQNGSTCHLMTWITAPWL